MSSVERTKQMIEVMQAYVDGKEVETTPLHNEFWVVVCNPVWNWNEYDYRVKGFLKPSINWDEVHDDYNWLTKDRDGSLWLYTHKPKICNISRCWGADVDAGGNFTRADVFKSLQVGNCDWKDSLVSRHPNKEV